MKDRNFVHKHAMQFQKAHTFKDRKKATKKGYVKHKNLRKGVSFYLGFCYRTLLTY